MDSRALSGHSFQVTFGICSKPRYDCGKVGGAGLDVGGALYSSRFISYSSSRFSTYSSVFISLVREAIWGGTRGSTILA